MLTDAASLPPSTTLRTDVVVVGAGPAGIAVTLDLARSGHNVLLLDSGGPAQERASQELAKGTSDGETYYRLERSRIRAFGGTSQHWMPQSCMRARPLDHLDFDARPEVGRAGWPFGRDALEPDYRRAQEICRLGPYDYDVARWSALANDKPLPLGEQVETISFQAGPLDNFPNRIAELTGAGNVHVLLHATVRRLHTDDFGTRVERLSVAGPDGRPFTVQPQVVVLASGGIDNPRLLLASDDRHLNGLGNRHDLVGRYFTEHPHVRTGVIRLDDPAIGAAVSLYERKRVDGTLHIAMIKISDEVLRAEGALGSAWALHPADEGSSTASARAIADLRDVVRHRIALPATGRRLRAVARRPRDLAAAVRSRVRPHRVGEPTTLLKLLVMSEQLPDPESRVLLGRGRDRFGERLPHVHWRLADIDHRSIALGQRALDRAFREAGLGQVQDFYDDADPPPAVVGGFHHMGTTRMATSPRKGVVDADQRLHGVANCYVTGSSVFPTVGYANPTLTIVALAARLARHLRGELGAVPTIGGGEGIAGTSGPGDAARPGRQSPRPER